MVTVKRPGLYKDEILKSVKNLGWDKDPYLKSFSIGINFNILIVAAKLLKNLKLVFNKRDLNPGINDR